jgi:hypothetical protein
MTPELIIQNLVEGVYGPQGDAKALTAAYEDLVKYFRAQMGADVDEATAQGQAKTFLRTKGYTAPGQFREEVAPDVSEFYDPDEAARQIRIRQEERPQEYYQQWLSRQGTRSFSPDMQRFLEGLGPAAEAGYETGRRFYGPTARSAQTFREYLDEGGKIAPSPIQMQQRLQRIGEIYRSGGGVGEGYLDEADVGLMERMGDLNPSEEFNLAWSPYEAQLSPMLRQSARSMALRRYGEQREAQPDVPFLQWLSGRKGNWFSGPTIPAGTRIYGQ